MQKKQYVKDFDKWNIKKKFVNDKDSQRNLFIHEREVWWCAVGVNIGVEIDGKNADFERPVLVVKKFNGLMFWGIPLTSKARENPYIVKIEHQSGTSYAILSQMRLFSSKRIFRKVGVISESSFNEIMTCLRGYF